MRLSTMLQLIMESFKKDVVYYYDQMIGTYHYTQQHPMKPLRVAMTDELVRKYKLDQHFDKIDSQFAQIHGTHSNQQYLTTFHSDQYIDLIKSVNPQNRTFYQDQLYRFNFKQDCPVMERLYDYCLSYSTGSITTASLLCQGRHTYGINWSGGLHHAKQSQASGFCYVNDCVLAIIQLLKTYQRVLYVDIDIHHGDGVEQAFYLTDRVMTCSFHKFKDYFPGTGHIDDIGKDYGMYHAVNFPLDEGLDDQSFQYIFEPVVGKIIQNFKPEAILLQGGTDSLSGDRLGCFNLSARGHGTAAQFIKKFNIPTLFFGGGGYTLRNVPRAWAYQTSIVVGKQISDEIPQNQYSIYFAPQYKIHMPVSNMQNQNTKTYLDKTIQQIVKNLDHINRPGVQLNVNGIGSVNSVISQFGKVNMSEVMREKRDLWENANADKNNDKND